MKNQRITKSFIGITVCILICSCTSPAARQGSSMANLKLEVSGSPFRVQPTADGSGMEYHLVPMPVVKTGADTLLQEDILADIGRNEVKNGGQAIPKLIEVRSFTTEDAHAATEIWLVDRSGKTIAYRVSMTLSLQGGTDISLHDGVPVVQ
jgi:hypothetical protein